MLMVCLLVKCTLTPCSERAALPRARRLSAEDLRGGLGAVGRKMSSAAVERLVSDLDISGCGSLDLEARAHPAAKASTFALTLPNLCLTE